MARVFTAIDIEDQEILDELEKIRDTLDLGFKPVRREKMHLTLEFFKDLDEKEIESVKDAMDSVSVDSFSTLVKGIGVFPSREYIRVVWAGIENDRIHEIYRQVSGNGIESDNSHDFTPHATLMRVENLDTGKKRKLQKMLDEYSDHEFGELEVNSIKMFESSLTQNGAEYNILHEAEL